jgi:hypothetical protein
LNVKSAIEPKLRSLSEGVGVVRSALIAGILQQRVFALRWSRG